MTSVNYEALYLNQNTPLKLFVLFGKADSCDYYAEQDGIRHVFIWIKENIVY
jgi:hypothetical protein